MQYIPLILIFTGFDKQCLAQRFCKLSEKLLTVRNINNSTFLIFLVFTLVFPLISNYITRLDYI